MLWWLGGILLTLGAMQIVAVRLMRRHDGFDKAAAAVNALSTAAAILFAGYWYIYERKGKPEADTKLKVIGLKIAPDTSCSRRGSRPRTSAPRCWRWAKPMHG